MQGQPVPWPVFRKIFKYGYFFPEVNLLPNQLISAFTQVECTAGGGRQSTSAMPKRGVKNSVTHLQLTSASRRRSQIFRITRRSSPLFSVNCVCLVLSYGIFTISHLSYLFIIEINAINRFYVEEEMEAKKRDVARCLLKSNPT